jgi:phage tail sheath protein FI
MIEQFLHGIEIVEKPNDAKRSVQTVSGSIAIIGTAEDANHEKFPLNIPVILRQEKDASLLGKSGTLRMALNAIYQQCNPKVIVIRIAKGKTDEQTINNLIGKPEKNDGPFKEFVGIKALLLAENLLHEKPGIICTPGFSHHRKVVEQLILLTKRLSAIAVIDPPPKSCPEQAVTFRKNFDNSRLCLVYPEVIIDDKQTAAPASPYAAALIAKNDSERGFWCSPSNQNVNGIMGLAYSVDFAQGARNTVSHFLNENNITTFIYHYGFKLWGNRTLSRNTQQQFLNVVRTLDTISQSLVDANMWAIDKGITKLYIDSVCTVVNNYLRSLQSLGAIHGGNCAVDPKLNSKDNLAKGKIIFSFEVTPTYPAEHIVFTYQVDNSRLTSLF